jgi:hypothetical protein
VTEARGALAQRSRQLGQALERSGNAQLVMRQAGGVAEQPLDVLGEAPVAEPPVSFGAPRGEQAAPFLEVQPCPPPCMLQKRRVYRLPLAVLVHVVLPLKTTHNTANSALLSASLSRF